MKTGRNDPCHCGSGKKYKKCCLKKEHEAQAAEDLAWEKWFESDLALGRKRLKELREKQAKSSSGRLAFHKPIGRKNRRHGGGVIRVAGMTGSYRPSRVYTYAPEDE